MIEIRTIHSVDRDREIEFIRGMSERSRYLRFQYSFTELDPEQIDRFVNPKYPDEMALVAIVRDSDNPRQIGVARYAKVEERNDTAEIGLAVADDWQGKGIGTALLQGLREVALEGGIEHLIARILPENRRMKQLAHRLGFGVRPIEDGEGVVKLGKRISDHPEPVPDP